MKLAKDGLYNKLLYKEIIALLEADLKSFDFCVPSCR